MIVLTEKGLILIDTPWNKAQTHELMKLAKEKFNQDIVLAFITHAHEDRIGGIDVLLENKIEVRSTKLTAQLAAENNYQSPLPVLDASSDIELGGVELEVFYPGEGHSRDNITVWLPKYKVLFAGCFVKSMEAENLGSTLDANINQWPDSIQKVKDQYPDIQAVIPGHGKSGGSELLDHTLDLLSKNK